MFEWRFYAHNFTLLQSAHLRVAESSASNSNMWVIINDNIDTFKGAFSPLRHKLSAWDSPDLQEQMAINLCYIRKVLVGLVQDLNTSALLYFN